MWYGYLCVNEDFQDGKYFVKSVLNYGFILFSNLILFTCLWLMFINHYANQIPSLCLF
jgi:formate-dependent nitrite reductase membrane component NrfD